MIDIAKLMRKMDDGTDEQYYPETHVSAILGLSEFLKSISGNGGGKFGVSSINGKTGAIFITPKDLGIGPASNTIDGLLTKKLFQQIQDIINGSGQNGSSDLSVELVSDGVYQILYKNSRINPRTTISAIDGLEEVLTESGIKGPKGDKGEQGPPGIAENLSTATEETDGLMSAADKTQIVRLTKYSFVKTGEI